MYGYIIRFHSLRRFEKCQSLVTPLVRNKMCYVCDELQTIDFITYSLWILWLELHSTIYFEKIRNGREFREICFHLSKFSSNFLFFQNILLIAVLNLYMDLAQILYRDLLKMAKMSTVIINSQLAWLLLFVQNCPKIRVGTKLKIYLIFCIYLDMTNMFRIIHNTLIQSSKQKTKFS